MPKLLIRIVSLLLIPALIGDPALAVAMPQHITHSRPASISTFGEQVLIPHLVAAFRNHFDFDGLAAALARLVPQLHPVEGSLDYERVERRDHKFSGYGPKNPWHSRLWSTLFAKKTGDGSAGSSEPIKFDLLSWYRRTHALDFAQKLIVTLEMLKTTPGDVGTRAEHLYRFVSERSTEEMEFLQRTPNVAGSIDRLFRFIELNPPAYVFANELKLLEERLPTTLSAMSSVRTIPGTKIRLILDSDPEVAKVQQWNMEVAVNLIKDVDPTTYEQLISHTRSVTIEPTFHSIGLAGQANPYQPGDTKLAWPLNPLMIATTIIEESYHHEFFALPEDIRAEDPTYSFAPEDVEDIAEGNDPLHPVTPDLLLNEMFATLAKAEFTFKLADWVEANEAASERFREPMASVMYLFRWEIPEMSIQMDLLESLVGKRILSVQGESLLPNFRRRLQSIETGIDDTRKSHKSQPAAAPLAEAGPEHLKVTELPPNRHQWDALKKLIEQLGNGIETGTWTNLSWARNRTGVMDAIKASSGEITKNYIFRVMDQTYENTDASRWEVPMWPLLHAVALSLLQNRGSKNDYDYLQSQIDRYNGFVQKGLLANDGFLSLPDLIESSIAREFHGDSPDKHIFDGDPVDEAVKDHSLYIAFAHRLADAPNPYLKPLMIADGVNSGIHGFYDGGGDIEAGVHNLRTLIRLAQEDSSDLDIEAALACFVFGLRNISFAQQYLHPAEKAIAALVLKHREFLIQVLKRQIERERNRQDISPFGLWWEFRDNFITAFHQLRSLRIPFYEFVLHPERNREFAERLFRDIPEATFGRTDETKFTYNIRYLTKMEEFVKKLSELPSASQPGTPLSRFVAMADLEMIAYDFLLHPTIQQYDVVIQFFQSVIVAAGEEYTPTEIDDIRHAKTTAQHGSVQGEGVNDRRDNSEKAQLLHIAISNKLHSEIPKALVNRDGVLKEELAELADMMQDYLAMKDSTAGPPAMVDAWIPLHDALETALGFGSLVRLLAAAVESFLLTQGIWSIPDFVAKHERYDAWTLEKIEEFAISVQDASFWKHAWEHIFFNIPFLSRMRSSIQRNTLLYATSA